MTFAARARAVFTIPGRLGDETALDPVGLSPAFPQPMVGPLIEVAQELVLPGLDLVPPNTVVPLETNTRSSKHIIVGLNTEMGRELLWRGFPADPSTTYFDRFWDAPLHLVGLPTSMPISAWAERALGEGAGGENFVMLVRSEFLQSLPRRRSSTRRGRGRTTPYLHRRVRARPAILRL